MQRIVTGKLIAGILADHLRENGVVHRTIPAPAPGDLDEFQSSPPRVLADGEDQSMIDQLLEELTW